MYWPLSVCEASKCLLTGCCDCAQHDRVLLQYDRAFFQHGRVFLQHDSLIGGLLHQRLGIGAIHLFCLLMALCWLLIIVLLLLSTQHQAGKGRRYS